MSSETLMLIDGNSLLYRAFYALPLLHNKAGEFTNGVYGFLTMYRRLLAEQDPSHVLVAFDRERKSFRNQMFADYKAQRSAPPEELRGQFALLREVLDTMNVSWLEIPGYEGDDIIGSYSLAAVRRGLPVVIVTGDRDALQLIGPDTQVCLTKKGISETEFYDEVGVMEKWGVSPAQMIEVKALMGDSSDNIPGVTGIGEKTALKLIKEFGNLEGIYEHLEQLSGKKLKENLSNQKDMAFLSRELGRIVLNIPLEHELDEFSRREPNMEELRQLFNRLEFRALLQQLEEQPAATVRAPLPEWQPEIRMIETREQAEDFFTGLSAEEVLVVQVEGDYHHPMWAKLRRVLVERGGCVAVFEPQDLFGENLKWLQPVLEDRVQPKYLHNAKAAEILLRRQGISLRGVRLDLMLLAYVLDPGLPADDLLALIRQREGRELEKGDLLTATSLIRPLVDTMLAELEAERQELLWNMEMPLSAILTDMEFLGVRVERDVLAAISEELSGHITKDESMIYELAGEIFNINSPQQLGQILFEKLGLSTGKKTKSGYSTNQEVLEALYDEHEVIAHIMNYRQLTKLKSTYTDALQKLIHPETGRVHTIFRQTGTVTGRLSSIEPNLQNIPIRLEEGRRLRRAFVAPSAERLILSADYSQIDLRCLAHISKDEILIETFRQGVDIHTRTAAEIFGVPLDAVGEELRRRAKAVNFGIIYGISGFGLARGTGVSRIEATRYIESYLDSYPGVKQYMEDIVRFGQQHGYVETLFHRRRYLPDLNANNRNLQAFARRMALNTPIQGTSADIIKLAMIAVQEQVQTMGFKSRMLLQVHDELVFELERTEFSEFVIMVKECMEGACTLSVPLEVTMKTGPNWYDMSALTMEE